MADFLTVAERSIRMSQIKSRNTKPEIKLRSELHKRGYRFRIHRKDLPGNPDIVFPSRRMCVFVNGCFWHGHKCGIGHVPKTNIKFWQNKILANRVRDAKKIRELRLLGWRVVVVWECSFQSKQRFSNACQRVEAVLNKE